MSDARIGFVGGGKMAEALVRGLVASGRYPASSVRASDPSEARRELLGREHGIVTSGDNAEIAAWANVVVLAVKPGLVATAASTIAPALAQGALVVSIAAGVPLALLEAVLPKGTRVVRAMPNTPAIALAGATALASGAHATAADLDTALALFESVGTALVVDEQQLDAVTGLAGSGPAYAMLVIEALADGGVKMGLSRKVALELAAQTLFGSAKLLLETKQHPAALRDDVTSPGGTTIAGLHALETAGARAAFIGAVESATRRSRELGADLLARTKKS